LVLLYVAKFIPTFSLWGENFDASTYFSVYSLSNVAKAFKRPINFDRTKTATNIYRRAQELGLVQFRKSQGRTYVTTTQKGDEYCIDLLKDFITWARIHGSNLSDVEGITSKGFSTVILSREVSEFHRNLIRRIDELNSNFQEEIESYLATSAKNS